MAFHNLNSFVQLFWKAATHFTIYKSQMVRTFTRFIGSLLYIINPPCGTSDWNGERPSLLAEGPYALKHLQQQISSRDVYTSLHLGIRIRLETAAKIDIGCTRLVFVCSKKASPRPWLIFAAWYGRLA